jgi:hypothetical protein
MTSFGSNLFNWGFSLQFVATIFFAMAFVWMMFAGRVAAAYVALLVGAFTGLGGLVIATIVCAAMLAPSIGKLRSYRIWRQQDVALPTLVLFFCLLLWLAWRPSEVSGASQVNNVLAFLYEFVKSSLFVSALYGGLWKAIALGALTAAGFYFAVREFASSNAGQAQRALCAMVFATIGLMVAIAIGRSGANPWWPGLEMHYGYLATPVPILSWLLISRHVPSWLVNTLGVGLLVVYAIAFVENANWRITTIRSASPQVSEISYLIQSCGPPEQIVNAHLPRLYHVDTPEARALVRDGIETLRRVRGGSICPPASTSGRNTATPGMPGQEVPARQEQEQAIAMRRSRRSRLRSSRQGSSRGPRRLRRR